MSTLFVVIVIALVIGGLTAPAESLSWWRRGSMGERSFRWPTLEEAFSTPGHPAASVPDELPPEAPHYMMYLSGIGISSPDELPVLEIPATASIAERLRDTRFIWNIYPYSVDNIALTQGRLFSGWWRTLARWKFEGSRWAFLGFMINLRNAFQVFVSVDPRYGPVFNQAVAQQIMAALIRHGYVPEHRRPVTLLGWSGGAQIAAASAWWLANMGIPVRVVSMAGMLGSPPGIDRCLKIWHLRGTRDLAHATALALEPRRWRIWRCSTWNRAIDEGRLEMAWIPGLAHTGKRSYYNDAYVFPDGSTPCSRSVDAIVKVIVDAGLDVDVQSEAPRD